MKLSERSMPIIDVPVGSICLCELSVDLGEKGIPLYIPEDKSSGLGYVTGIKINPNKTREPFRVTGAFMVYIRES